MLATGTRHTIYARFTGFVNSILAAPTSGTGTISVSKWNGTNQGGGCGMFLAIDGKPTALGVDFTGAPCQPFGQNFTGFDPTKWRNGTHEIQVAANDFNSLLGRGPVISTNPFVAGNVSGSTVTLTAPQTHYLVTNRPVVFTSTG